MKIKVRGRNRIGLALRVFSKTPEQVDLNASRVLETARRASALRNTYHQDVFAHILISVACDTRRIDHDCGLTAQWLRDVLEKQPIPRVRVREVHQGDLFCGLLNDVVTELFAERCRYVTIFSHEALEYLTKENMWAVHQALEAGAKVVPVAIKELQESVLEGRAANTFTTWDVKALLSVGGFDLAAAQPYKDERLNRYLRGWTPEDGELFYPEAGVEEIIPLCRIVEHYGRCIAPILPYGEPTWAAPDRLNDPEGFQRCREKLGTKWVRQEALANRVGFTLSHLQRGVMSTQR